MTSNLVCIRESAVSRPDSGIYRDIFARDLGVCAKCGLDTRALRVTLHYIKQEWERLACLPIHLPALMKAFHISGQPRGFDSAWARQEIAEKVRHPDLGLRAVGESVEAMRLALGLGMVLKPPTFQEWLSGLGVWVKRYPRGLWEINNQVTLCLGCHQVETKKQRQLSLGAGEQ